MRPAALLAIVLLALAGAASAHGPTVKVFHERLEPAAIEIPVGATIHFTNVVMMPGGHTLVADDGSFRSPRLNKGDGWHHTFETAGEFEYHIKEHPEAKGRVIVTGDAPAAGE